MADFYCDLDAVSDGGGATWADAFNNFASLVAAWDTGDTAYIGGTTSDNFVLNKSSVIIVGVNSSGTEDGTKFVIDGATGIGLSTVPPKDNIQLRNAEFKNCTSRGVFLSGNHKAWNVKNVWCHDNSADGWYSTGLLSSSFQKYRPLMYCWY